MRRSSEARRGVVGAHLGALVLLAGCEPVQGVRQCEPVISALRPAIEAVQALEAAHEGDERPEGYYTGIATRYETLAETLDTLPLTHPRLKSGLKSYTTGIRATAASARKFEAVRHGDQSLHVKAAQRAALKATSDARAALRSVSRVCYPH